jgi:RNA recognition motif-containing protein
MKYSQYSHIVIIKYIILQLRKFSKKNICQFFSTHPQHGVFVGGLPWSADEETVKKDFGECGEIVSFSMPMNPEGQPKGIAFVDYTNAEGVKKALEFDGTDYGGRTIQVKVNDQPKRGGKGKGKGKGEKREPGEKPEGALSIIVKNLTFDCTEDCVRSKFEDCGEITRVSLLKDRETYQSKGICFVDFAETESTDKAVKKCNEDLYGRQMFVDFAGNKPAKGEGKDGKGKGKGKKGDGKKGKGKGKKGEGKKGKGKAPIPAGKVESFDSDSE